MTTDWSTFSEDVHARSVHPNYGCAVCKLIESVDPEDSKMIQAVLDDPANSSRSIRNGMRLRGVRVAAETVTKHRRGECS